MSQPPPPFGVVVGRPAREVRDQRRWIVTLGVVAVLTMVVVWLLADRLAQPRTTPTAPAAAAPVAPAGWEVMVDELAALAACRDAALGAVAPVGKVRATWNEHGRAHADGRAGRISEQRMRQVWASTLKRRPAEDQTLVAATGRLERACRSR